MSLLKRKKVVGLVQVTMCLLCKWISGQRDSLTWSYCECWVWGEICIFPLHANIGKDAWHSMAWQLFITYSIFSIHTQVICILSSGVQKITSYWFEICVNIELWRLRVYPRWIFRKNSIEFSIGFDYYLYKCLLVCVHISHNHKTLTKNYIVLHKCSMLSWPHCTSG